MSYCNNDISLNYVIDIYISLGYYMKSYYNMSLDMSLGVSVMTICHDNMSLRFENGPHDISYVMRICHDGNAHDISDISNRYVMSAYAHDIYQCAHDI